MAISQVKQLEVETRRKIEEVLFGLGLTPQDVATALDLGRSTVGYDINHRFRGKGRVANFLSPLTPEQRDRSFAAAFCKLQELTRLSRRPELNDEKEFRGLLVMALKRYVNFKKLQAIGDGIGATISYLSGPQQDLPKYRSYHDLLRAVFGGWDINYDGYCLLQDYLLDVVTDLHRFPGRDNFASMFAAWAVEHVREHFRFPLNASAIKIIDEAITALPTVREQQVLRLRFGLGWDNPVMKPGEKGLTLEQLGTILGATRERIRQIEAKALRGLRKPPLAHQLGLFLMPQHEVLSRLLNEPYPPMDRFVEEMTAQ